MNINSNKRIKKDENTNQQKGEKNKMQYSKEDLEKLSEKNSFLIQKSIYEDLKLMSDGEVHYLVMRIFEYVLFGIIPDLNNKEHRFILSAFNRFKSAYDSDSMKWLRTCNKKSENKKEEWKKRRNKSETKEHYYE